MREAWPALAALGAVAAVPRLAVMLVYAASGRWDAWVAGNLATHRAFYGEDTGPAVAWEAGLHVVVEQAPLWAAALLALALGWGLARDERERRSLPLLLAWVAAIGVGQVFLRWMADHYFLQFLPPLCLLAGLLLGRAVLARLEPPSARRALLAVLVGMGVFALARDPVVNAAYVLRDRHLRGEAWAGDAARQVAADIRRDLRPGDAVYVVGRMPIVYHLTGAAIPTRFAFTGLPNREYPGRDGCPWVPPAEELRRVLDARPRFVVVERGAFLEQLPPELRGLLLERLGVGYRLRAGFDRHWVHRLFPFERAAMTGDAAADVYELARDDPSP